MSDFITHPLVIVIATILLTSVFSKYINPILPEAKVISKKMKPLLGGLSVLFSKLFILGIFMFFPIIFTIDFMNKNGQVEELHTRFIIICCSYCVALSLYLGFSIYVSLKGRIKNSEDKIERLEENEEIKKMST